MSNTKPTTMERDTPKDTFLSHLAKFLSEVNKNGTKIHIDAMSLIEFTFMKIHHDQFPREIFSECHVVGSAGEGITGLDIFTNNSDIDAMLVMKTMTVIERHPGTPNEKCKLLLRMNNADTIPGYVKLKILKTVTGENTCNTKAEDDFLPNTLFRDTSQRHGNPFHARLRSHMLELLGIPGDKITVNYFVNGPSSSANVETKDRNILTRKLVWMESADFVIGLKCNEWPEIADEWIERSREYNWPSVDLIEKAVSLGCYVVPIGGRQSITEDLEWRISFVLAERLLIRNMNSIQRFIYSVLKTIRKEIFGEFSVIISSYIIKTIILWVMEENDTSSLQPKDVIEYVQKCFKKLFEFLENDFCPNYFMRKCNLFHLRYSENEKSNLTGLVRDFVLSTNFPEILCSLQPIANLRRSLYIVCLLSGVTGSILNFARELFDTLLFKYQLEEIINRFVDSIVNSSEEFDANVAIKSINVTLETLKANRDNFSPLLQEILTGVLSCMKIRAVCAASFHKMQTSPEPISLEQRVNVNYLIKNANLQVENLSLSEVAQLAHVFFSFGCTQDCLHLLMSTLDRSSSKSTPHIKVDNVMSIFDVAASFLFNFQGTKAGTSPCQPVLLTKLYPFEFPMLTKDIQVEMQALKIQQNVYSELLKRKLTFKVTLDPLVYICYMKFKCLRLLEDNIGSCITLKEFGDIVHKKLSHRFIALSLLGCCLKENGRMEEAILMFYRSFCENKERLSTLYHVAIMLKNEFAK